VISSLTGLNNLSDISGKLASNLVNQAQEPGRYSATWSGKYDNGGPVPRGLYYIRFTAGNVKEVKQIMLIR
jgi:flagellar hook assembly protein FlgD